MKIETLLFQMNQSVVEFQQTFFEPPYIFNTSDIASATLMLMSELDEYQKAQTKEERADAIIDLLYFALGFCYRAKIEPITLKAQQRYNQLSNRVNAIDFPQLVKIAGECTTESYQVLSFACVDFYFRFFGEESLMRNFNAVHNANMSKCCDTIETAEEAQSLFAFKTNIVERNNKYLIYCAESGKLLKPFGWIAPKITL